MKNKYNKCDIKLIDVQRLIKMHHEKKKIIYYRNDQVVKCILKIYAIIFIILFSILYFYTSYVHLRFAINN